MAQDLDPSETREWLDALDSVVEFDGAERAAFLIAELHEEARRHAVAVPFSENTPYLNTIPVDRQPSHPGDREIEHKIRSLIRWNAVATVLRAHRSITPAGSGVSCCRQACPSRCSSSYRGTCVVACGRPRRLSSPCR
jgi:pyruvate dehydrogenase E1 component